MLVRARHDEAVEVAPRELAAQSRERVLHVSADCRPSLFEQRRERAAQARRGRRRDQGHPRLGVVAGRRRGDPGDELAQARLVERHAFLGADRGRVFACLRRLGIVVHGASKLGPARSGDKPVGRHARDAWLVCRS
jgi:hypothetical protein